MRIYETICICPPTLDEEGQDEFADLVHEVIYDAGGKIIKQERWGKRRLAYRVKSFKEGIYYYYLYGGDGRTKVELERRLNLAEECIRFLTVRLDNELKGRKHKIFTEEELQLALQMDKPKRAEPKPVQPQTAASVSTTEEVKEDQPVPEPTVTAQQDSEVKTPEPEAAVGSDIAGEPPSVETAESPPEAGESKAEEEEVDSKMDGDKAAESTDSEGEAGVTGEEEEEGK